jgi:hypothetical protein
MQIKEGRKKEKEKEVIKRIKVQIEVMQCQLENVNETIAFLTRHTSGCIY